MLQGTVRRLLGKDADAEAAQPREHLRGGGKRPVWEDRDALAAIGGNAAALAKLRRMLLQELPGMQAQLAAAQERGDAGAVAALVHKLRASCGFTGAARLQGALEALALAPLDLRARRDLDFAASDSLATLP